LNEQGFALFLYTVAHANFYLPRSGECAPMGGFDEVFMPGAIAFRIRQQRLRGGTPPADESWRLTVEAAAQVGLLV